MADGSVTSKFRQTVDIDALQNFIITQDRSGTVIFLQSGNAVVFPQSLPVGFNCEIINARDNTNYISGGSYVFYSTQFPQGASGFEITAGGTIRVNVLEINSQRHYYITGDIVPVTPPMTLPTTQPSNPVAGTMYLENNSTLMIWNPNVGWTTGTTIPTSEPYNPTAGMMYLEGSTLKIWNSNVGWIKVQLTQ
jgi:hypothetical protein